MKHLLLASLVSLILACLAHANPGPSPKPSASPSRPPVARPASPRVVVQTPPRTVHVHTRVQSPTTAIRWVYYRADVHTPWVCYGGYHRSADAQSAAHYIRGQGMDAFVR